MAHEYQVDYEIKDGPPELDMAFSLFRGSKVRFTVADGNESTLPTRTDVRVNSLAVSETRGERVFKFHGDAVVYSVGHDPSEEINSDAVEGVYDSRRRTGTMSRTYRYHPLD